MVEIRKLPKKEFEERFGRSTLGITRFPPRVPAPTIFIPGKASTATRLHELYHAEYSPMLTDESIDKGSLVNWFIEEMDAVAFSSEMRGRNYAFSTVSLANLIAEAGSRVPPTTALGALEEALRRTGRHPLSKEDRSWLWHRAKRAWKEERYTE